jgi:hypothetical protein
MSGKFTTAGLGLIPGTGGDRDNVVRRQAWEDAHPGAQAGQENPGQLVYAARWADGSLAASTYGSLGALMDLLDKIEDDSGCPVHGQPS